MMAWQQNMFLYFSTVSYGISISIHSLSQCNRVVTQDLQQLFVCLLLLSSLAKRLYFRCRSEMSTCSINQAPSYVLFSFTVILSQHRYKKKQILQDCRVSVCYSTVHAKLFSFDNNYYNCTSDTWNIWRCHCWYLTVAVQGKAWTHLDDYTWDNYSFD